MILNIKKQLQYDINTINTNIIYYSTTNNKNAEAYVEFSWLKYKGLSIFEISKVKLPGEHNLEKYNKCNYSSNVRRDIYCRYSENCV